MTTELNAVDADLDAVPGTVSVWVGRAGGPPAYHRHADATHYAASTMKAAVLGALYCGGLDLDAEVPVDNAFDSAVGGRFGCDPHEDGDRQTWERLGGTATLRWLARRMIVRSGNLATNIVLTHVGRDAVNAYWRAAGARHSAIGRLIDDGAARAAGITNPVTAADLAALLPVVATGEPLEILLAQEVRDDLAAGLPAGVAVAHKNGWVTGVRHSAGIVFPSDSPAYTLVVCTTTELAPGAACRVVARVAAASWADRHTY
jgi:beta-lactamase class A